MCLLKIGLRMAYLSDYEEIFKPTIIKQSSPDIHKKNTNLKYFSVCYYYISIALYQPKEN